MKLAVGEVLPGIKGTGDSVRFGMGDSGAELLVCFGSPTEKEIAAIKEGPVQFGMFTKENVIFILAKFGTMPWMDAPFHVGLAKGLTHLQDVEQGMGYGCTIILVDSSTGIVKALRYVGLSTEFSKRLKNNIEEQMNDVFDVAEYDAKLSRIMGTYSTKDMVRFSEVNCKIRSDQS